LAKKKRPGFRWQSILITDKKIISTLKTAI